MGKPINPPRWLNGPATDLFAGFSPRKYLHHGNSERGPKAVSMRGSDALPAVSAHMST